MAQITWTQGDSAPEQPFTVTRTSGSGTFVGATAKFKIGNADTYAQINAGNDTCTISSATATTLNCTYSPALAVLANTPGSYIGELEITYADGKIQTVKKKVTVIIQSQVV